MVSNIWSVLNWDLWVETHKNRIRIQIVSNPISMDLVAQLSSFSTDWFYTLFPDQTLFITSKIYRYANDQIPIDIPSRRHACAYANRER